MRKIILKVHDLEFENTQEGVDSAMRNTVELLQNKGYTFDGILISVEKKIAYIWKIMKTVQPQPPAKAHA